MTRGEQDSTTAWSAIMMMKAQSSLDSDSIESMNTEERGTLPRADSGTSSTSTDSSATNATQSTSSSKGTTQSISSASSLGTLDMDKEAHKQGDDGMLLGVIASVDDNIPGRTRKVSDAGSRGRRQQGQGEEKEDDDDSGTEDEDEDYSSCIDEGESEEQDTHGRSYSDETLLPTPTVELKVDDDAAAAAAERALVGRTALPHTPSSEATSHILAHRLHQLKTHSSISSSSSSSSSQQQRPTAIIANYQSRGGEGRQSAAAAAAVAAEAAHSSSDQQQQQQQQGFPWNASSSKMRMSSSSSNHSHQSHGTAATPSSIFSAPDFDEGLAQEQRQHARSRSWAAAHNADAAADAKAARKQNERSSLASSSLSSASASTSRSSRPSTAHADMAGRGQGTHSSVAATSSSIFDARHPSQQHQQHHRLTPSHPQNVSTASPDDPLLPSFLSSASSSILQPAGLTKTPEALPADAHLPHPSLKREDTVRASSHTKSPSQSSSRLNPEQQLGGEHSSALDGSAVASMPASPVGTFQHLATFAASSSSTRLPASGSSSTTSNMQIADAALSRGRHFSVDSGVSGQHERQQRLPASAPAQSIAGSRSGGLLLAQPSGSNHASISSRQHRPSTASSACSNISSGGSMVSARPWVKDSDASSVRSGMSSDGSLQDEAGGADTLAVMSPCVPPQIPFLPTGPQPAGCRITVDASAPDHFLVVATLPGFTLENITLALKRNGSLHILADRYDDPAAASVSKPASPDVPSASAPTGAPRVTTPPSVISPSAVAASPALPHQQPEPTGGHFERMVELGDSAIGAKVTAEFDGKRLKVTVLKRRESVFAAAGGQTSPNKSRTRGSLSMGAVPTASGVSRSGWNGTGTSTSTGTAHANSGASEFSHGLAKGSEHWNRSVAGQSMSSMPMGGDGSRSRRHSPTASMSLPTQQTRINSAMQSGLETLSSAPSTARVGQRYVATNWGL